MAPAARYRVFVPDGFGKSAPGSGRRSLQRIGQQRRRADGSVEGHCAQRRRDVDRSRRIQAGRLAHSRRLTRLHAGSRRIARSTRFPIDPRRVYLFGHSGGAGHVLLLGLLESEYFAAVAAHAGALRPDDRRARSTCRKRKIPMAIWIGTKDQMVPIKMVRDTLAILTARGFPGEGVRDSRTHALVRRARERGDGGGVGVPSKGNADGRSEVLPISVQEVVRSHYRSCDGSRRRLVIPSAVIGITFARASSGNDRGDDRSDGKHARGAAERDRIKRADLIDHGAQSPAEQHAEPEPDRQSDCGRRRSASRRTSRSTSTGEAPTAMRTPNSRVRRVTR